MRFLWLVRRQVNAQSSVSRIAAAMRAYAKAGFKEVGRRRGAVVTFGRRYDAVIMDAVAPEFSGSVLAKMIPEGGSGR